MTRKFVIRRWTWKTINALKSFRYTVRVYSMLHDSISYRITFVFCWMIGFSVLWLLFRFYISSNFLCPLQWRHNERDRVSNHRPHDCLLNSLFNAQFKKISKLRVTGLCAGNSPVTGEFPAQRVSKAEMFPFDDVIICFYHAVVICGFMRFMQFTNILHNCFSGTGVVLTVADLRRCSMPQIC